MEKIFFVAGFLMTLVIFLFVLPFFVDLQSEDFSLNQFEIQWNELLYGTTSNEMLFDWFRSYYSLLFKKVFNPPESAAAALDLEDNSAVLNFLFERIPSYAIVYPTETYYYFNFSVPHGTSTQRISGNMRLLDAEDGILHLGYFDKSIPHDSLWYKPFKREDGIEVKTISDYKYRVSYKGKSIVFKLNDIYDKPPRRLRLLPEEEFAAQIQDEASLRFFLYFNNKTNSFYYILNEEARVAEETPVVELYLY